MIIFILIFIIIFILIFIGCIVFFLLVTNPSSPELCEDNKTYKWNDNGTDKCCYTKPTEWSRLRMTYTNCPTKSPSQGSCPIGKYEFKNGCCNIEPENFDTKIGKYTYCNSPFTPPKPSTPTPSPSTDIVLQSNQRFWKDCVDNDSPIWNDKNTLNGICWDEFGFNSTINE